MNAFVLTLCICAVAFERFAVGQAPKQKINIGTLNVQPSEFATDFNGVLSQIVSQKRIEPAACERLRKGLQQIERQFDLQMFKEYKTTSLALFGSKMSADEQNKDLTALSTAYQTATAKIIELKQEYLKDINTKCAELDASKTWDDAAKKIEDVVTKQRDAANKIIAIPKQFDDEINTKYVPVENLINT